MATSWLQAVLRGVVIPCLSFGPLLVAIGRDGRSVPDHLCLMGGAVMLGVGLVGLYITVVWLDQRLAEIVKRTGASSL
jgi:hypothetical protein